MQHAIKLENISNLIASPSRYPCRKKYTHIHGSKQDGPIKFLDFVGAVVISSVVWKTPKYTPMLQTVKTSSTIAVTIVTTSKHDFFLADVYFL